MNWNEHPLVTPEIQHRFELDGISKQITDEQYPIIERLIQESYVPNMQTIEIGSWTGLSAVIIGRIVQRASGKHHCIDWFKGNSGGAEHLTAASKKHNIRKIFEENIAFFGLNDTIEVYEMISAEARKYFTESSANLVFIDGNHNYEFVKQDIELWYPVLKVGGYLVGHDYETTKDAVREKFPNIIVENDLWYLKKT